MPEPNLYAETTGTINGAVNSYVTLTHGIGETPDDCGIYCTNENAPDPITFLLIRKNETYVRWQIGGARSTANFRCWAARGRPPLDPGSLTTFAYVPAISRFVFLPDLASFALPAPLVWKPKYPDFARRAFGATEWEGKFSLVVPTSVLPVPELSWSPIWPDFARMGPHSVEELTTFAMRPFAPIWTAYEALLLWDPDKYGGVPTAYFEAVLEVSSGTAYARIAVSSTNVPLGGSEVSTTASSATRVRSAALTMPTTATLYRAEVGVTVGATATIRAARLIIET